MGSDSGLSLEGPTKVLAYKTFLFTEGSLQMKLPYMGFIEPSQPDQVLVFIEVYAFVKRAMHLTWKVPCPDIRKWRKMEKYYMSCETKQVYTLQ